MIILLKILSLLLFLISGLIWKKISGKTTINYHLIFFRSIFTILTLLIIYNLNTENESKILLTNAIKTKDWIIAICIGLFSFWGLFFYTKSIQEGRFSMITPLTSITTAISFCSSLFIYDEKISSLKILSLIIILVALIYHQKKHLLHFALSKEIFFILLFSLIWGISFVLYLIPIKSFGALNFSLLLEICVTFSCVFLLLLIEKSLLPKKINLETKGWCALIGILVAFGSYFSNLCLSKFEVSFNILLGLGFEIIVLSIGLFLFKEKIGKKDWVLIISITFAGGLMLL